MLLKTKVFYVTRRRSFLKLHRIGSVPFSLRWQRARTRTHTHKMINLLIPFSFALQGVGLNF